MRALSCVPLAWCDRRPGFRRAGLQAGSRSCGVADQSRLLLWVAPRTRRRGHCPVFFRARRPSALAPCRRDLAQIGGWNASLPLFSARLGLARRDALAVDAGAGAAARTARPKSQRPVLTRARGCRPPRPIGLACRCSGDKAPGRTTAYYIDHAFPDRALRRRAVGPRHRSGFGPAPVSWAPVAKPALRRRSRHNYGRSFLGKAAMTHGTRPASTRAGVFC